MRVKRCAKSSLKRLKGQEAQDYEDMVWPREEDEDGQAYNVAVARAALNSSASQVPCPHAGVLQASRRILHSIEVCRPQNVPAICLSWVAHAGHVAKMLPSHQVSAAQSLSRLARVREKAQRAKNVRRAIALMTTKCSRRLEYLVCVC